MAAVDIDEASGEWRVLGEWRPEDDLPILILRPDDLDRLTIGDLADGLADVFEDWRGHSIKAHVSRPGVVEHGVDAPLEDISFVWGVLEPNRRTGGGRMSEEMMADASLGLVIEPPRKRAPGVAAISEDAYWTALIASVRRFVERIDCRVIVSSQRRFDRSPGALELVVFPKVKGAWTDGRRREPLSSLFAIGSEILPLCAGLGRDTASA